MFNESQQGTVTLSPKASFIVGLIGGVLVLCTIGFFILLGLVLKGGVSVAPRDGEKAPAVVAPSAGAPSAAAPTDENQVGTVAPVTAKDHVVGAKNAEVTLVLYTDLQCPFCARFHPVISSLMQDPAYKSKLKLVVRNFPLSFHPNAIPAANAAECAAEQGKYMEYVDKVFANNELVNGSGFSPDVLKTWAKDIGLNASKFDACFSATKYQAKIDEDRNSGTAANVSGTPATIIIAKDGTKTLIPGALGLDQVKQMVDAALK
jgi:protein-disulfide isomerase